MVPLVDALRSASVFVDGDWVESKDQDPEGDVRLVQLADVGDAVYIDKSDRYLTSAKARALRCTFLEPGDILVARMPDPLGRACIFPGDPKPCVTVVDVCIIRPDLSRHDPRWLVHCLNAPLCRNQIAGYATGTTRSRISRGNLGKVKIPEVPLPEQRRIAEILDKADALRAKRRAALAELDILTQSIFLDMFGDPATNPKGWPVATLGELINVGPQNGIYKPSSDYGTGTLIIRIDAFYDGVVTGLNNLKRVRLTDQEISLYGLRPDEVVINRVNSREYLGKSALITDFSEPVVFESNIMRLGVDPAWLDAVFLIHLLQTGHVRSHILRSAKDAVNQSSINQQDVKGIPVILPPLPLQQMFALHLRSAKALAERQRAARMTLDSLCSSLQNLAFLGRL
jgi:type I restriction enzyme, S subunit